MSNYYYLGTNLKTSNASEGLLNLSGMSNTLRGSDSIATANAFTQPTFIAPIVPFADAAKAGTDTLKEVVTKGTFKLGFMWFAFVLILLGLTVIVFKNDAIKSAVKIAAK